MQTRLTDEELAQFLSLNLNTYEEICLTAKGKIDRNENSEFIRGLATGLLAATKIVDFPKSEKIAIIALIRECALLILPTVDK